MSYAVRWRKAIILSIFLHIFFGVAVGYMTVGLTLSPTDNEQLIELDVMALAGDGGADSESEPQLALPTVPEPEVSPKEDPPEEIPPLIEPPPVVSEDVVNSEPVPLKAVAETDKSSAVNSNKRSAMGTPPVVLVRAEPIYPSEVERIGRKVVVVVKVKIMENGLPGKVDVVVPSGQKSINDAAVASAKKWIFKPAKDREGRPMVCSTILSIPFTPK